MNTDCEGEEEGVERAVTMARLVHSGLILRLTGLILCLGEF
jgi:hypothetical protein